MIKVLWLYIILHKIVNMCHNFCLFLGFLFIFLQPFLFIILFSRNVQTSGSRGLQIFASLKNRSLSCSKDNNMIEKNSKKLWRKGINPSNFHIVRLYIWGSINFRKVLYLCSRIVFCWCNWWITWYDDDL
jgi:hypothetical protein